MQFSRKDFEQLLLNKNIFRDIFHNIQLFNGDLTGTINYGFLLTRDYGEILLAELNNKLVFLGLLDNSYLSKEEMIKIFLQSFKTGNFSFIENISSLIGLVDKIDKKEKLDIILIGTDFQKRVWLELCKIKEGSIISYESLALRVGGDNKTRAVASAVAKNKISLLVPCHRVIRKDGSINKYLWGQNLKRKLLHLEFSNIGKI